MRFGDFLSCLAAGVGIGLGFCATFAVVTTVVWVVDPD
jgi:hypothetical protein